jgi:hypothetical protein
MFAAIDEAEANRAPAIVLPRCDMHATCREGVTYLDSAGYVYCTKHGLERQSYEPCRKLRPYELKRLARGEPVERY